MAASESASSTVVAGMGVQRRGSEGYVGNLHRGRGVARHETRCRGPSHPRGRARRSRPVGSARPAIAAGQLRAPGGLRGGDAGAMARVGTEASAAGDVAKAASDRSRTGRRDRATRRGCEHLPERRSAGGGPAVLRPREARPARLRWERARSVDRAPDRALRGRQSAGDRADRRADQCGGCRNTACSARVRSRRPHDHAAPDRAARVDEDGHRVLVGAARSRRAKRAHHVERLRRRSHVGDGARRTRSDRGRSRPADARPSATRRFARARPARHGSESRRSARGVRPGQGIRRRNVATGSGASSAGPRRRVAACSRARSRKCRETWELGATSRRAPEPSSSCRSRARESGRRR